MQCNNNNNNAYIYNTESVCNQKQILPQYMCCGDVECCSLSCSLSGNAVINGCCLVPGMQGCEKCSIKCFLNSRNSVRTRKDYRGIWNVCVVCWCYAEHL